MVDELLKYDFKILGVYTYDIKIPEFKGDIEEIIKFKATDALKLVMMEKEEIEKPSSKAISKLQLASQLNENLIVLYDFSKGLNAKELRYFNLFFRKITKSYRKKVIIVSRDVNYLSSICDTIAVYKNGIQVICNDWYDNRLYDYMDMPNIIKFINLANRRGAHLSNTTDLNELIKDIYRSKNES